MATINKRRNSILKKKSAEEDTTTEIKARRISFSGKKSIKEFIAGEEAETIWGTSYEESADDLKISSSESGLVNVNVKRIQLRNRRVDCDLQQQQQKRRSSSRKKKVQIAENDKENLCIATISPAVEILKVVQEINSPVPLATIEQPQPKSPTKSELALEKIELNPSKTPLETMSSKKLVVDFCNTFDFINFSAQINKTITIEESLDVTLNESEIQMFKFRIPVTTTEISPNTSNVLCKSIQMSEDDLDILKDYRKQKSKMKANKEQIIDEELKLIEEKKRGVVITDISNENDKSVESIPGTSSKCTEIYQVFDARGSKRKSENTPHSFFMESTLVDVNSPMRKKPMHTVYYSSMNDTKNLVGNFDQKQPNTMATIYDNVNVEESVANPHSTSDTNFLSHTICDGKTINESSIFPNTTASCLALGNHTDSILMELTLCDSKAQENDPENRRINSEQSVYMNIESSKVENSQIARKTSQRETINASIYMDEESPKPSKSKTNNRKDLKIRQTITIPEKIIEDAPKNIESKSILQKTTITAIDIYEDSIQDEPEIKNNKKVHETIYDPIEIKEDKILSHQNIVDPKKNKTKRESIYIPIDMEEDSPNPSKTNLASKVLPLKERNTIFGLDSMIEEIPVSFDNFENKNVKKRQTIYESDDVEVENFLPVQNSVPPEAQYKRSISNRSDQKLHTILVPENIIEDSPKAASSVSAFQKTIDTSLDMLEDSVQQNEAYKTIANNDPIEVDGEATNKNEPKITNRKLSIYTPSEMIVDSQQDRQLPESYDLKKSQTIVTPEDLVQEPVEDPPIKTIKKDHRTDLDQTKSAFQSIISEETNSAQAKANVKRQTTYKQVDIAIDTKTDLPINIEVVTPADVKEVPPKLIKPSKIQVFRRDLSSTDLIAKKPKQNQTVEIENSNIPKPNPSFANKKKRQSIHTAVDMVVDSPKPIKSIQPSNPDPVQRRTICRPVDITTDSSKPTTKATDKTLQKNNRQTIHTPLDMLQDSPTPREQTEKRQNKAEEKQTSKILQVDEKRSDLQFRRPTKLFAETFKALEKPLSSTNSLMDKVMQEMGYSMNFEFKIPEETPVKLSSLSKQKQSQEELYKTINLSIGKDNEKTKNLFDKAMELSMANETSYQKNELENKKNSSDDDFLMELSLCGTDNNPQEILTNQHKVTENSIKLKVDSQDTETLEENDANSGRRIINESMDLSTVQFQNSFDRSKQQEVCMDSRRQTIHFDQDLVEDEVKESQQNIRKNSLSQTVLIDEDLEIENVDDLPKSIAQESTIEYDQKSSREIRRKTLHLNEDLEVENTYNQPKISIHPNETIEILKGIRKHPLSPVKKTLMGRTVLMIQDLDISDTDEASKQTHQNDRCHEIDSQINPERSHAQQTIHFDQELDLSKTDNLEMASMHFESNRRTKYLNQDLDVDESLDKHSKSIAQKENRQTIHLNQDQNFCQMDVSQVALPMHSFKNNQKTNYSNQDLQENRDPNKDSQPKTNRQTIHLSQDLDLSEVKESFSHGPIKSNRRTNYLTEDLDIDGGNELDSQVVQSDNTTKNLKKDPEFNKHLHPEELSIRLAKHEQHIRNSRRQTILESQDLDMSIDSNQFLPENSAKSPNKTERRTVYFQQDLEIEDLAGTDSKSMTKLRPVQNINQETENEDESIKSKNLFDETKRNTEENACRFPMRDTSEYVFKTTQNQQTVHFTHNNGLDESIQVTEIGNTINQSVSNKNRSKNEKDMPNKFIGKPRRVTICDAQPIDMDESILPKPIARKSSFMRTLNFDDVSTEITSKSITKLKVPSDDDSPIFNALLRAKYPTTPEVDRSLAEYLRVEAEADFEEEVFYDAEDGTEDANKNKRQTCHIPINLEESGMQPFQLLTLKRQTTFSPKDMTNASPDYSKPNLTYKEVPNLKNESQHLEEQKANHFSKSIMDVSLAVGLSSKNNKQGVLNPSLELNFDASTSEPFVQKSRQTLYCNESINTDGDCTGRKSSSFIQSVRKVLMENKQLCSQFDPKRFTLFPTENDASMDVSSIDCGNTERESAKKLSINPDGDCTGRKPSSFSQSVRKVLMENKQLCSQFDSKRFTLYPTEKDASMDVSSIDCGTTETESTPTKNRISRIPQLIGSAKKLESLKKSMEFIQQELPNIGCHLRNNNTHENEDHPVEDQGTPKRLSTSIPKKLVGMDVSIEVTDNEYEKTALPATTKLQESFDTIDIPRKVISSVRKKLQEFPQTDEKELEERCVADPVPIPFNESFDTVELPRRGTTFQRNDTIYINANEKDATINASQKSLFQLEDPPITVSDVSTFFSQKPFPNTHEAIATYSPNTIEALSRLNVNENPKLCATPDTDDTTHNFAHFKKRYVELTCDSLMLSDSRDNIEKTHLSLVNTIDDESQMIQQPQTKTEVKAEVSVQNIKPKSKSSVCTKCKCQRLNITQNDTTFDTFILEPPKVYKIDFSELEELAKKPKIADVAKVWRQKLRESDSFNVSDDTSMAMDVEVAEEIENLLTELADARVKNAKLRQERRKEKKIENSFIHNVREKMQSKSDWILDDVLLFKNKVVLTHTRIRTFAIVMNFTPNDPRGVKVKFDDIKIKPNMCHTPQWKPYEYALHYQLLLELPFDLKTICTTSEYFFDLIEHVEKVIDDVLKTGKELFSIVLTSPASLIRESTGRLYVRKYVRTKTPQLEVKRTEFHIEIRNIKRTSYQSIAMPPLYEFDENIQMLPVGNEFLREFLKDPLKFIKK